jgi:hypothetical protein
MRSTRAGSVIRCPQRRPLQVEGQQPLQDLLVGQGLGPTVDGTPTQQHDVSQQRRNVLSAPYLSGMALQPRLSAQVTPLPSTFSPLLIGDGIATEHLRRARELPTVLSAPYLSGMALLPLVRVAHGSAEHDLSAPYLSGMALLLTNSAPICQSRNPFSPLLVGDGIATELRSTSRMPFVNFQPPTCRGWHCYSPRQPHRCSSPRPFSPLLVGDGIATN